MLAGRSTFLLLSLVVAVVDLVPGFRDGGALFAFVPFLDEGTLFVHSPSGAGAEKRGRWPFIDGLEWNDADDAALDDCAFCCLPGEVGMAAASMPSPGGRAVKRE